MKTIRLEIDDEVYAQHVTAVVMTAGCRAKCYTIMEELGVRILAAIELGDEVLEMKRNRKETDGQEDDQSGERKAESGDAQA